MATGKRTWENQWRNLGRKRDGSRGWGLHTKCGWGLVRGGLRISCWASWQPVRSRKCDKLHQWFLTFCSSKESTLYSFQQHIYWKWIETKKISMATMQGWHTHLRSIPYFYRRIQKKKDQICTEIQYEKEGKGFHPQLHASQLPPAGTCKAF